MPRQFAAVVLVGVGILLSSTTLSAQARPIEPDAREVLAAVARHFADMLVEAGALPDGGDNTLILVPDIVDGVGLVGSPTGRPMWRRPDLKLVAEHVGAVVGTLAEHHECTPTHLAARCSMKNGADAVIYLGVPDYEDRSATVSVRVVHRSIAAPDPQEAWRVSTKLRLEKIDGAWEVRGAEGVSVD